MSRVEHDCLASWEKYCSEFEIKRWDENSFNVDFCSFSKEAYKLKKFAFVSDVARLNALYNEGGIYFDTDMLLTRSIPDNFLRNKYFVGMEDSRLCNAAAIGFSKGNHIAGSILDTYLKMESFTEDKIITKVISPFFLNVLSQDSDGLILDPSVFYPLPYKLRKFHYNKFLKPSTIGVHLWGGSWKKDEWTIKEILRYCISKFYVPKYILDYKP